MLTEETTKIKFRWRRPGCFAEYIETGKCSQHCSWHSLIWRSKSFNLLVLSLLNRQLQFVSELAQNLIQDRCEADARTRRTRVNPICMAIDRREVNLHRSFCPIDDSSFVDRLLLSVGFIASFAMDCNGHAIYFNGYTLTIPFFVIPNSWNLNLSSLLHQAWKEWSWRPCSVILCIR